MFILPLHCLSGLYRSSSSTCGHFQQATQPYEWPNFTKPLARAISTIKMDESHLASSISSITTTIQVVQLPSHTASSSLQAHRASNTQLTSCRPSSSASYQTKTSQNSSHQASNQLPNVPAIANSTTSTPLHLRYQATQWLNDVILVIQHNKHDHHNQSKGQKPLPITQPHVMKRDQTSASPESTERSAAAPTAQSHHKSLQQPTRRTL